MIPLLQLALDTLSMEEAFAALQGGVAEAVDVIEAGTLLICAAVTPTSPWWPILRSPTRAGRWAN